MEHPANRLTRVYALLGRTVKFDFRPIDGFYSKPSGRGGRWNFHKNPVTELRTCDRCGKMSTPKKVSQRSDVWAWNLATDRRGFVIEYDGKSKSALCTACWNIVRRLVKAEDDARECSRLLNKLTRTIRDERKNQNHR